MPLIVPNRRIYRPKLPSLAQGLVGRWLVNGQDITPSTVFDVSGNRNHGSTSNGPTITGAWGGEAVRFNASATQSLTIPSSASLSPTTGLTMAAWLRPTSTPSGQFYHMFVKASHSTWASPYADWALRYDSNGPEITAWVIDASVFPGNYCQYSITLPVNSWSFIAATYDGAALSLYVNGTLRNSKAISGALPTNGFPLYIGRDTDATDTSGYMDGALHDSRIYNRALSQGELFALYAETFQSQDHFLPILGISTGGSFTLTAAKGTFALTGEAATLEKGSRLTAAKGTFALTGEPAVLEKGSRLVAAQGSFALTGEPAVLKKGFVLSAAKGTFALTGNAATLTKTGANTLLAQTGNFALTGRAAILEMGRRLTAAQGSFTLTGEPATLRKGRSFSAATGSFALTGYPVTFHTGGRGLPAGTGAFAMTGKPINFLITRGWQPEPTVDPGNTWTVVSTPSAPVWTRQG